MYTKQKYIRMDLKMFSLKFQRRERKRDGEHWPASSVLLLSYTSPAAKLCIRQVGGHGEVIKVNHLNTHTHTQTSLRPGLDCARCILISTLSVIFAACLSFNLIPLIRIWQFPLCSYLLPTFTPKISLLSISPPPSFFSGAAPMTAHFTDDFWQFAISLYICFFLHVHLIGHYFPTVFP